MEQEFDLRGMFAVLRRRYLWLVLPAAIIAVLGVIIAYAMPSMYQARATILVESQQIPTDLASPTVTASASERVQVIEQRLLARDNLLQIANKFNLYAYQGPRRTPTTIVEDMRAAISIEPLDATRSSGRRDTVVIGFAVTFEYRNPTIASRVTNELVSSILSQNIESRLSRASETSTFFSNQLKDIDKRLLALEDRIAEFKRANEADLPETLPTRRVQVTELIAQIGALDQRLRAAKLSETVVISESDAANIEQLGYQQKAKELELQSLREERAKLAPLADREIVPRNRITQLDRTIALAEVSLEALNARIVAQGSGGLATDKESAIKVLEAQRDELSERLAKFNQSIARTPVVEVQLNAMNRQYDNLQAEYRQAQARLEDALTGERLEENRQSERFEVIEQASVPTEPASPKRPRIMMAGGFGGIALGVMLMVLLEMLDHSVHGPKDLERKLQLRPIAIVPLIETAADRFRRRFRFAVLSAGVVATVLIALVAIHIYYLPLDLLTERIWQRIAMWLPVGGIAA